MPPKKATEDKPKRAPSTWMVALKEWNAKQPGAWCIPKRGSPEYDQVRALMLAATAATEPAAPKATAQPRAKKPAAAALKVDTKKPKKSKIDLSESPL